jgi:PAS domain S-box-containing protein
MLQYVQSVQEQYESANEELQAASEEVQSSNEELQSLNEELTTSKEELESSNEELTTLNEEMANRNAELNRLNSDLVNFQTSAQLVIVLLARDLTIRRFSAQAEKQFNLQASDVGRPIGQIRHGLELPELEELITEVIDSVRAQERELRSRDGRWFSLRVRPYLTLDNQVDGAVLVLLDIDAIKRGEEALADSEARLHAMFEATSVGISESDAETSQLLRVNERLARITGYGADDLLGKTLLELTHPDDRAADMQGHARLLRGEGTSYAVEKRLLRKDGASVWVHVTVNLVQPMAGRPLRTVAITLDIGERQQAQQALAHLGAIVTSSDDAIIGKDMNGVIRSWNRGAERLFGYTAAEAIGQPVTLLIPADRANEEPGILERIRHGETIDHYETVRQRKDGSLRDISLTVSPIRDAAGHVIGAAKIARDITESKQAERAMRESHVRFEALFDASPIGMYLVDADLRILLVSPSARPVFGDIGELIGRDLVEIIHNLWPKAYADEIVRRFRHTLETGEPYAAPERIEQRLDRGVIEVYQWQINRIALAQSGYGVVCYFQDISAQVQSRAAIAASAQRLRFVMDSAPQKIFTAMPNGDFDYLSPQWVGFTGLTLEQLKDSGWTQCIHPDDVAENIRVWQHAVDTAEPFQFEHRLRRADGEYRWHISRAVAMRGDEGQVVMWVGSNTDIHEQLQAQNQLRQFASDLSEADHRKDEFLAMLAHELRNPLAPILNAVEILRLAGVETSRPAQTAVPDGREPRSLDTDGAARSALQIVERQARQMVRLVDDLLDVSRISRGKIELRRTTVDLSSLMQQVADGAHPITDSLGHELTIALPREPVLLDADPTRLAQLIGNLIHNACKFTERGGRIGVTVQVEGEAAVPPGAPRRQLVVRVRDNGIGIAADQLERIFQMFTQVDASLARSSGGLGIGLALVKKLVELHGGTVAVHSAGIGQGSEFVVRLPIVIDATADELAQPNVAAESAAAPSALRILVVDDNHDAAESLATILQLDGHETRLAHDGLEAVETAAKFRPDVIFLDIGLPKLDGYEAGRRIRAQIGVGEKRPLLVALSGWGQDEHRRRSAQAGFDAHLVKPVQPEALMKLLA